jgi:hypothetical protein
VNIRKLPFFKLKFGEKHFLSILMSIEMIFVITVQYTAYLFKPIIAEERQYGHIQQFLYEGHSENRSQMDIKHNNTCDI